MKSTTRLNQCGPGLRHIIRGAQFASLVIVLSMAVKTHAYGADFESAGRVSSAFREASRLSTEWNRLHSAPSIGLTANQDELMRLLDDPDPSIRVQAAKELSRYVYLDERVRTKLLEVLDREGEVVLVRRQIIKSLSRGAEFFPVQHRLVDLGNDVRESADIRGLALKALYPVANLFDVRATLLHNLDDHGLDLAIRRASAWALCGDYQDPTQRWELISLANNGDEAAELRLEAIKSLAPAMPYYEVQSNLLEAAKTSSLDPRLREGAILAFTMIRPTQEQSEAVGQIASEDPNPEVRRAAVTALGGLTREVAVYFHLTFYGGEFLDPLASQ